MKCAVAALAGVAMLAGTAQAVTVQVTVTGEVEYNQINPPPLGNANPGDPATLTFLVDSDVFEDSMSFPVRGYPIDQSSFVLDLGGTMIPLQDPFPPGQTPYFCIRNNDPAVDGFWVSTFIDFPAGVPLDQLGIFEQFRNNYYVTYTGDTLDSLDILDALGMYDFTGLTVFNWTVDDGPFNPLGLIFEQMIIEAVIEEIPAYVDIKPGSCPNAFNRGSNGVLPVGLLGTDMFDVGMVDIDSLRLSRADGMGGMVAPNEGPPGPHTVFDDVGAPFDGMGCECDELEPDGFTDLSIKFRTQEVVDALMLDYLPAGATVELVLSGVLMDGTAFAGSDCVQLVPPGTAPGMMSMTVGLPEVWTDAFPLDTQLDGGGFGTFQRTYPLDTVVTLTAQPDANGRAFLGWRINGNLRLRTQATIPLRITGDLVRVEAVYETLPVNTRPIAPDGSADGRPLRR